MSLIQLLPEIAYLHIGQVNKLRLCDGLVCFPEHALLEQQSALQQILLLAILDLIQNICYVLVVIQQHVLVWVCSAHVSLAVQCLHSKSGIQVSGSLVQEKSVRCQGTMPHKSVLG